MKKKSSFSTQGQRADIGSLAIVRLLPNRYADAVGPFVFFDHIAPASPGNPDEKGTGAHPHRGIATLTYMLEGEAAHYDSAGNFATVHSGGVQWMKAGRGILHDETINPDSRTATGRIHAFQFWINLPAARKGDAPEYRAVEGDAVPRKELPAAAGWIKVIVGAYEDLRSGIPTYSDQFLFHVRLEPRATFRSSFAEATEVAVFLPSRPATINEEPFNAGEFVEYDRAAGTIEVHNDGAEPCDVLLFGGAPYTDPIVAEGPFVMGSVPDLVDAYRDLASGKYGSIDYDRQRPADA